MTKCLKQEPHSAPALDDNRTANMDDFIAADLDALICESTKVDCRILGFL